MKKTEVRKELAKLSPNSDFLVRCVIPQTYLEEEYRIYSNICRKSHNFNEFVENYLSNDKLKYSQGACELFKKVYFKNYWYKLREFLGEKCQKTHSDAGSLKIGNDDFSLWAHNDKGDGCTRYAVFDTKQPFSYWFGNPIEFFEVKKDNSVFIYSYDCGEDKQTPLPSGKYNLYSYEGLILIEKYEESISITKSSTKRFKEVPLLNFDEVKKHLQEQGISFEEKIIEPKNIAIIKYDAHYESAVNSIVENGIHKTIN